MTPLKQANRHDPDNGAWGDCHRTAIAAALDLPRDEVPHFMDNGTCADDAQAAEIEWLAARGMVRIVMVFNSSLEDLLQTMEFLNPRVCYILGGQSKTGCNHSVVGRGGTIVCDPSQTDAGIIGPCDDGYYWVTFFGTARAAA